MSKFMMFALVFLLAAALISAETKAKRCGRHGDDCQTIADCCPVKQMQCNRFAKRCQIYITPEELLAAKERITGRKGKDMK